MFLKLKCSRSREYENHANQYPTDRGTNVRVLPTPKCVSCNYKLGGKTMTPRQLCGPSRHAMIQMWEGNLFITCHLPAPHTLDRDLLVFGYQRQLISWAQDALKCLIFPSSQCTTTQANGQRSLWRRTGESIPHIVLLCQSSSSWRPRIPTSQRVLPENWPTFQN